ncbi:MAG TPA: HD domain-containing protein [Isosphaeraceae bacterium]|jgi:predicted HD phosphohydrolase|nr:HD domain-containing protein [Isosphaeraceae bacterium]
MSDERTRRQIAFVAAQLMYSRVETEYFTAKRKAARQLGIKYRFRPGDLPSNSEIRDQIQAMARMHEGDRRLTRLRDMRIEALRLMRRLAEFRPRLIGSVLIGHVRHGSDIDLHVFSNSLAHVTATLDEHGLPHDVERKRIIKLGEERSFTHIHVLDRYKYELTLYPEEKFHYVFKSSITGKAIEWASIAEVEDLLRAENPEADLDDEVERVEDQIDRFELYRMLLQPLEEVKQSPKYHPEGDALYHSLQVFELAREDRGYDEEFLLAALLHDVGKAIDPADHVSAGLQALEGAITERTATLIAFHMEAQAHRSGTLGARQAARLKESTEFDDLMLLCELDRKGRVPGAIVCELSEALDYLRELEAENER